MKFISELAVTTIADVYYSTFYIPTNTPSVVIDSKRILQPLILCQDDQAFIRFNYLQHIEHEICVQRGLKREKKTVFLVSPPSMAMLFDVCSQKD